MSVIRRIRHPPQQWALKGGKKEKMNNSGQVIDIRVYINTIPLLKEVN